MRRAEVISDFHFLTPFCQTTGFMDEFSLSIICQSIKSASARLLCVSRYEVGYFFPPKANEIRVEE